jgi:hypothetical protein
MNQNSAKAGVDLNNKMIFSYLKRNLSMQVIGMHNTAVFWQCVYGLGMSHRRPNQQLGFND